MEVSFPLKIIIAVFSLVILMVFMGAYWAPAVKDIPGDYMCKNSIGLKALTKGTSTPLLSWTGVWGTTGESFFPTTCNMHRVSIGRTDTEMEIIEKIADEMSNCWWRFGEGTDFYSNLEQKVLCFQCAEIRPKEEVTINVEKFSNYLATKKGSKTGGKTYSEYIAGVGTKFYEFEEEGLSVGVDEFKIDNKKALYVLFVAGRQQDLLERLSLPERGDVAGAALVGAGVGGVIGSIIPVGGTFIGGVVGAGAGAWLAGLWQAFASGNEFHSTIVYLTSDLAVNLCEGMIS